MNTKVINQDSFFLVRWFIKLYIWVWKPNLSTLTDCRLFWGTLFSPLALLNPKRKFRPFIRISCIYFLLSLILFAIGLPGYAAGFLFVAIILVPLSFLFKNSKESELNVATETETVDDEEYPRIDAFFRKLEVIIDKFFQSRLGDIVIGIAYKLIDLKERKCSFIIVENL